jgi:subtilase family serine protease
MFLRVLAAAVLLSATAFAGSKPVCPGPAAAGSARCHAHVQTDEKGNPNASSGPSGYGPSQFISAYGLPTNVTSAPTVAIVDAYDDPKIESDLGVFSSQFKLAACTTANGCFKKVNQTGGTIYPQSNAGWALEIALDVETVHGICPNCKILLVEANSSSFADLLTAEDYAAQHADVVSNSWGGSEFSSETGYDSHFNHMGIPITVSSGDSGYGVQYPASSQYVTAVGGTTLRLSGGTRTSETVWSGAGSGCSAYEPKPNWQKDTGCSHRTVADVAADADPNTGAAVYDSVRYQGRSGWFQVGGTSLAAPLIAAVYALAGNSSNTVYGSFPYSSSVASGLYDVTSGSNGSCGGSYLCTGVAGYDGPTGNGTPKGTSAF